MNIKRGDDHHPPKKLKHRGTQMRNKKIKIITCSYTRYQNNKVMTLESDKVHFLMRCSYPTSDADWSSCRP